MTYDLFILTSSPSMDILISSNLERLIYEIAGEDADACAELMKSLSENGKYEITPAMKEKCRDFIGGYASEEECAKRIHEVYANTGYVMDTHTAVASTVYKQYVEKTKDVTPTVIVSTASPFKFTRSVMEALEEKKEDADDFELIDRLSAMTGMTVPNAVEEIRNAEVLHDTVCDKEQMKDEVIKFLK